MENEYCIYCDHASPTIKTNVLYNTYDGTGIYCHYSNPTIGEDNEENLIINNHIGIMCNHSSPDIQYNWIEDNRYGIWIYYEDASSTTHIMYNEIDNNDYGVYVEALVSNPIINLNNIYGNVEYGVYNADPTIPDLNAQFNWWGDADGPNHPGNPNYPTTGDAVSDYVDYDPWLTAPVP